MENLKYTFDQVNDWIKTADQKAMILGSFSVAGFIYQIINFDKVLFGSIYTIILLILSLSLTFIAIFFWLKIIYPRLDNKLKKSKIFFQHIANAYSENIDLGLKELASLDEKEFKRDLASQIIINSVIAKEKYANIQKFIWTFCTQLAVLALLFINLL